MSPIGDQVFLLRARTWQSPVLSFRFNGLVWARRGPVDTIATAPETLAFDVDEADPSDEDTPMRVMGGTDIVPGDPTIGVVYTLDEQWLFAFDGAGKAIALTTQ